MRRIKFTTILLIFTFCAIPIISILMIHHLTLSDTLSKMGTGSFGASYSCISINEPIDTEERLVNTLNSMDVDFALCLDNVNENDSGVVRAFYFNKSYANLPMDSGRFFKPKDFVKDNYVAVVGKDKMSEIYNRNNEQYITVFGEEYLVLGVIGYQVDTVLDDYIFINILACQETSAHMYLIDYISDKNAQEITSRFVDLMNESEIDATILSIGENFSDGIMPTIASARWFIGLLLSCFLCLLLISAQWINFQKTEVCIRRLVGASIKDIVLLIFGKYISIALISLLIGFLYCNVLYPAYFKSLLNGYAICLIFIAFFILWSTSVLLREPIEEAIK